MDDDMEMIHRLTVKIDPTINTEEVKEEDDYE
jgi:hypothetical protein